MMQPPRRRGWCPSLDEPMPTGDGLLVRVKPPGATMTPAQAEALAGAAARFGNGIIELTQRGNLQIRGLAASGVPPFAAAIRAAGLALPPDAERRRPVMPPPLLGADPTLPAHAARLTAALEAACAALPALPGKFAIHVDAGGVLGCRPAAATLRVAPDGSVGPGDRRDAPVLAGPLSYPGGATQAFALAPPFAQLDAGMLREVAALARRHATTLRVSPWRALLLACVPTASDIAAEAGAAWITAPGDARLQVVACIGAPGCASGSTPTRADAARLAAAVRPAHTIHVSGCTKGCAHPGAASLTFVAGDGRYHLVRNGRAGDPPRTSRANAEGYRTPS